MLSTAYRILVTHTRITVDPAVFYDVTATLTKDGWRVYRHNYITLECSSINDAVTEVRRLVFRQMHPDDRIEVEDRRVATIKATGAK